MTMKNKSGGGLYDLLTSKFVLLFSLCAVVVFTLLLSRIDAKIAGKDGPGVVYLQLAFFRENFEAVISAWGPEGVSFFLKTIWIDFIYPISYAVLLASAPLFLSKFVRDSYGDIDFKAVDDKIPIAVIIIIPFLAAFFDYIENILHAVILSRRVFSDSIIFTASVAATLKWALIFVSLFIVLAGYYSMRKAMRKKISPDG